MSYRPVHRITACTLMDSVTPCVFKGFVCVLEEAKITPFNKAVLPVLTTPLHKDSLPLTTLSVYVYLFTISTTPTCAVFHRLLKRGHTVITDCILICSRKIVIRKNRRPFLFKQNAKWKAHHCTWQCPPAWATRLFCVVDMLIWGQRLGTWTVPANCLQELEDKHLKLSYDQSRCRRLYTWCWQLTPLSHFQVRTCVFHGSG